MGHWVHLLTALLVSVRGDSTPATHPTSAAYSTTLAPPPLAPSGYLGPPLGPAPIPSSAPYPAAGYASPGAPSASGSSAPSYTTATLLSSPFSSTYAGVSLNQPPTSTVTSQSQGPLTSSSHPTPSRPNNQGYSSPLSSYAVQEPPYNPSLSYLLPQFYKNPPIPPIYTSNPISQPFAQFLPHYNSNPYMFSQFSNYPYFQPSHFQVPNPLTLLNNFVPPNSYQPMVHSQFRGPVPSPGYYSPNQPPVSSSQTQSNYRYPAPINNPLPYNQHRT